MGKLKVYEVTREQTIMVTALTPEDAANIAVAGFKGEREVDGLAGGVFDGTMKDVSLIVRKEEV